jgi:hypothetical protein
VEYVTIRLSPELTCPHGPLRVRCSAKRKTNRNRFANSYVYRLVRVCYESGGLMIRRPQPGVSFRVKCFVIFLMLAVFGWGLHTKLSHYSPSKSSSKDASATAKLLTDKSVEHSSDTYAQDVANDPGRRIEVPIFSAIHVMPLPQIALHQAELSLCNSCRYDSDGPNIMHLPPPTIS